MQKVFYQLSFTALSVQCSFMQQLFSYDEPSYVLEEAGNAVKHQLEEAEKENSDKKSAYKIRSESYLYKSICPFPSLRYPTSNHVHSYFLIAINR